MLETLYQFDLSVFKLINQTGSNTAFDTIMPIITNKYTWIPLYVVLIGFFIYRFRKKAYIPIIGLALAVGASDYLTSGIIKPNINRTRPCNIQEAEAIILAPCRNSPSFPSSHASNHFAIAVFLLYFLPKKWKFIRIAFLVWALAIAYSRVYVGVHFPFDVFSGAIIGMGLGSIFALSSKNLIKR